MPRDEHSRRRPYRQRVARWANSVLRLLSGNEEWEVSNGNHPYAKRCQLRHVDGPILIGYRSLPYPPRDNAIYAQRSGGITVLSGTGTRVLPTSPLERVVPVELTDADVGCAWGL